MLTEADLQALNTQDTESLANGWCELNNWRWPAWLPDPEEPNFEANDDRRGHAMDWILENIGFKECLRAWNRERMTPEEFEAFWNRGKSRKTVAEIRNN